MTELPDWMRGQVLLGKHDDEYVVVKLEENGELNVLLKGAYDDELRTVKLDDQGRLSAFVIDSVDAWGRMLSIGNAELAARLGSPVRYDQRGHLYYADGFEHGRANWVNYISGNLAAVALSPVSAAVGGYSLKLTAGSTVNHYSGIFMVCGILPAGKMGIAIAFAPAQAFTTFQLLLTAETGVERWEGTMRFDYTDNAVDVYAAPGGWEEVGYAEIAMLGSKVYNIIKLVVDIDTGKYHRVMLNEYEYDASAHTMLTGIPGGGRWARMLVEFEGRNGFNDVCYVDNAVLTTAEP